MKITLSRICAALLGPLVLTLGLSAPASAADPSPTINQLYSGYSTPFGGAYDAVETTFIVPTVNCQASPYPIYSGASEWVGLGGISGKSKSQTGSTLVQDGVSTVCLAGQPLYGAVAEVHPPENYPTYLCKFPGAMGSNCKYPVKPGDQVLAAVTYSHGGNYTLAMKDITKGWNWSYPLTIPSQEVPTTAEWVVEAGTSVGQTSTLANFGHVSFIGASYSTAKTKNVALGQNGGVTPLPYEVSADGTSHSQLLTNVTPVSPPGLFSVTYVGPTQPVFPFF
jgi:Peptidase A4 family